MRQWILIRASPDPGIILLMIGIIPVILRGAEGEVAESIIQNNPRPSGRGWTSKTVGEGQTRTLN